VADWDFGSGTVPLREGVKSPWVSSLKLTFIYLCQFLLLNACALLHRILCQVFQRALDCESRAKESRSSNRSRNEHHANMVEYSTKSLEHEAVKICVAEWNWGPKSKPFVCSSLKSATKSQQDEICYTFDVTKCDRFFDYLLQEKQIKLSSSHVILLPKHLKKHAYCKWHNSYSHATKDCDVFHR
jgi:hypothetical protein